MKYTVEVAGISHKNKDGEPRRDIVISNLHPDDSDVTVSLRRHSGNTSDKNAIGVYIMKGKYSDPEMIGFIPREVAKDVSPMIKMGRGVSNISIVRVWIPTRSNVATPVVAISFDGDWSNSDIAIHKKEISAARKKARLAAAAEKERLLIEAERKKSNPSLLKKITSFLLSLLKK